MICLVGLTSLISSNSNDLNNLKMLIGVPPSSADEPCNVSAQ